MCIRDRQAAQQWLAGFRELTAESGYRGLYAQPDIAGGAALGTTCLLYTSDAADDLLCVDLRGSRIIQKKTYTQTYHHYTAH